jgi:hypothetical protein
VDKDDVGGARVEPVLRERGREREGEREEGKEGALEERENMGREGGRK